MSSPRFSERVRRINEFMKDRLPQHRGRRGMRYALRVFLGTIVLWEIFRRAGDYAPIWATVSMLMVSEIETHASLIVTGRRVAHMAIGCAVGLVFLAIAMPSLWQLALAAAISAVASFYLVQIGGNWRTAPVATVIVMGAGFERFTRDAGMHEALTRSAEVLGGCVIALGIAWCANKLWLAGEEITEEVSR